jgi:hypothetical protein
VTLGPGSFARVVTSSGVVSATELNVRAGVPGQVVGKILNDKIDYTTLSTLCWLAAAAGWTWECRRRDGVGR